MKHKGIYGFRAIITTPVNWDIDNFIQRMARAESFKKADKVEKQLKRLIPKWQQWLLKKTSSRFLARIFNWTVMWGERPDKKFGFSVWHRTKRVYCSRK